MNHSQQDSRKILEDLNFKKQQLLSKGLTSNQPTLPPAHDQPVNSIARAALIQANASSFGFFVAQDSQFGNTILPVLPRFD